MTYSSALDLALYSSTGLESIFTGMAGLVKGMAFSDIQVNFTNKLLQHRLITTKRPVMKLEVVTGNLNYLLVLCNGLLTIHRLKDLLLVTRVPKPDVSTFCCSDGSPYYGMAFSLRFPI